MLSGSISANTDKSNDNIDFQSWNNVTAIGKFDALGITNPRLANFRWWMEGQGRFGDDGTRFSQAIIRPGIGYQIHRTTSIWLGYAWAPTTSPFASTSFDEHRIWQQVLWTERYNIGSFNPTVALRTRYDPAVVAALGARGGWEASASALHAVLAEAAGASVGVA